MFVSVVALIQIYPLVEHQKKSHLQFSSLSQPGPAALIVDPLPITGAYAGRYREGEFHRFLYLVFRFGGRVRNIGLWHAGSSETAGR